MTTRSDFEIIILSSGHQALDHRVFHKEAVSLAKSYQSVRVIAAAQGNEERDGVKIVALHPCRDRLERFLLRPLQCFLAAGRGRRRVIILHDAELLLWAPLARFLTGARIIFDVHEDFPQLLLRRTWIPAALRRSVSALSRLYERVFARACKGVIGVTESLIERFPHQHKVALYNLPGRRFISAAAGKARPINEREYTLVHLGTLSDERLIFLVDVLSELLARRPAARALIIGLRPGQERPLRERFNADQVTLMEQVAYDRIPGYLGACHVGLNIHPILYPHLRCAVPVKVFEYMAAGCNVVTSYLPELDRLLGEDGAQHVQTIFTPSAARFADEIDRLMDDPRAMARHQEALMQLVNTRWSWESQEDALLEFIDQIIRRKETPVREQVLDN